MGPEVFLRRPHNIGVVIVQDLFLEESKLRKVGHSLVLQPRGVGTAMEAPRHAQFVGIQQFIRQVVVSKKPG